MTVEFLFFGIHDIAKIYLLREDGKVLSDEEDVGLKYEYRGNVYCENVLRIAASKLQGVSELEYQQSFGRAANEIFVVVTESMMYTVSCMIDTYAYQTARMTVRIESEKERPEFDDFLEKLKIGIKDGFRPDWKKCIWVKDEQSEDLCAKLYPVVFSVENKMRVFVNKVLSREVGPDWMKNPGLEVYVQSYESLAKDFHRQVPEFQDVDDALISLSLEQLFNMIMKAKIYESDFCLTGEAYQALMKMFGTQKGNVEEFVRKNSVVKYDLWDHFFETYFGNGEKQGKQRFGQLTLDFKRNRNHIAHNKPMTMQAYKKMKENLADMEEAIRRANAKFEASVPSEEACIICDREEGDTVDKKQWERDYLRPRIEAETGVEILWREEILDLLREEAEAVYQSVYDLHYWDEQYEICLQTEEAAGDGIWQPLFRVVCRACAEIDLTVETLFSVDDEMDGDSILYFRYVVNRKDEKISSDDGQEKIPAIVYHNGCGYENVMEGRIELSCESTLKRSGIDDFLEDLEEAIGNLNPYIPQIPMLEYESAKDGSCPPVADFPCWECGNYGVSLDADFYEFGKCCYCGSDHHVAECPRCGCYYCRLRDTDFVCENCMADIEKE